MAGSLAAGAGKAAAVVGRRAACWTVRHAVGSLDRGLRIAAAAGDRFNKRAQRWTVEDAALAAATPQLRAAVCIRQNCMGADLRNDPSMMMLIGSQRSTSTRWPQHIGRMGIAGRAGVGQCILVFARQSWVLETHEQISGQKGKHHN